MNDNQKFKIGIPDGICLGLAIIGLLTMIGGIVYGAVGSPQGIFSDTLGIVLIVAGGAVAALFIIIFLIYEIVAVVKIKKARTILMLGSAPEAKRTPKALGAGFKNYSAQPSNVKKENLLAPVKIEANEKWLNVSEEETKMAEQKIFTVASSKDAKSLEGKEVTIMISLDKSEVENIIQRGKSVLFFKTLPIQDVKTVIVFMKKSGTWPGGIIGQFNLSEKRKLTKNDAWEQYGNESTLTKDEYDKYYKGIDSVSLIKIGTLIQYQQAKTLKAYGAKKPPIVFFYLK